MIETPPENRVQAKLEIPGFPDPAITHPNIRFQQTRELPREMRRTDSMPLVYVKKEEAGKIRYRPQVARQAASTRASGVSQNCARARTRWCSSL